MKQFSIMNQKGEYFCFDRHDGNNPQHFWSGPRNAFVCRWDSEREASRYACAARIVSAPEDWEGKLTAALVTILHDRYACAGCKGTGVYSSLTYRGNHQVCVVCEGTGIAR
jgi:hypothetical protein